MCCNPIVIKHPYRRGVKSTRIHENATSLNLSDSEYIKYLRQRSIGAPDRMLVPCRKCIECRKERGRSWRKRLILELLSHRNFNHLFITLTFDTTKHAVTEENIYGYIRKFIDRWRKRYGKSPRYWFVTELGSGDHSSHLHIHGIIFDVPFIFWVRNKRGGEIYYKETNKVLRDIWRYGITWCGYVNVKTINYILKYITKLDNEHPDFFSSIFCSPGIGLRNLPHSILAQLPTHPCSPAFFTYAGQRYSLPKEVLRKYMDPHDYLLRSYNSNVYLWCHPFFYQGRDYPDLPTLMRAQARVYGETLRLKLSQPSLKGIIHQTYFSNGTLRQYLFGETPFF